MRSVDFWKEKYSRGARSSSGLGSKGELLNFKVNFINDFIQRNKIKTILDFELYKCPEYSVSNLGSSLSCAYNIKK